MRRFDDLDLLVIYVDGLIFSGHTVLAAVGVDSAGKKHVLGLQHAATENAAAAEDLLTGLVERGISTEKKRLFVLDGSKALRRAVRKIFGAAPVQRCRAYKLRKVLDRLPKQQREQAKAAESLREGVEECFTINRLGRPPSLHRCLATTNIVESPNAGVRQRTRQ